MNNMQYQQYQRPNYNNNQPPRRNFRQRSASMVNLSDDRLIDSIRNIERMQTQILRSKAKSTPKTPKQQAVKVDATEKTSIPADEIIKASIKNSDNTHLVITDKPTVEGGNVRKVYKRIKFQSHFVPIMDELIETVVDTMVKPFYLIYMFILAFLCYDNFYSDNKYFITFMIYMSKWPMFAPIIEYANVNMRKAFMILFTKSMLLVNRTEISLALTSFTTFMVLLCREAPALLYVIEFMTLVISAQLYRGDNKRKMAIIIFYAIPIIAHCVFYHFENVEKQVAGKKAV